MDFLLTIPLVSQSDQTEVEASTLTGIPAGLKLHRADTLLAECEETKKIPQVTNLKFFSFTHP